MGIRETLNQNQGITTGVTIGIVVIALIVIFIQLRGGGRPTFPTKAYYTTDLENPDDSLFVDAIDRIPPFEHEGKQAVKAHTFSCDGNKTRFVGYLEQYMPEAKERIERERARAQEQDGMEDYMMEDIEMAVEYRKPGPEGRWVSYMRNPQAADEVITVHCPDGTTEKLRVVYP